MNLRKLFGIDTRIKSRVLSKRRKYSHDRAHKNLPSEKNPNKQDMYTQIKTKINENANLSHTNCIHSVQSPSMKPHVKFRSETNVQKNQEESENYNQ